MILCCFFLFQLYLYSLLSVPLCFYSFSWGWGTPAAVLFWTRTFTCLVTVYSELWGIYWPNHRTVKPEKMSFQPCLPSCLLQLHTSFDERITVYSNVSGFSWPSYRTMQPAKSSFKPLRSLVGLSLMNSLIFWVISCTFSCGYTLI